MSAIKAVRNRRAEMNVAPSKKAKISIETAYADTFEKGKVFFERLASASEVEVDAKFDDMDDAVSIITESARMYIPMAELVDFQAEIARLQKEKAGVEKELAMVNGKLSNENFDSKAPAAVVEGQRQSKARLEEKLALLDESLQNLEKRM